MHPNGRDGASRATGRPRVAPRARCCPRADHDARGARRRRPPRPRRPPGRARRGAARRPRPRRVVRGARRGRVGGHPARRRRRRGAGARLARAAARASPSRRRRAATGCRPTACGSTSSTPRTCSPAAATRCAPATRRAPGTSAGTPRDLVPAVPDLTDAATAHLLADVVTLQAQAGLALGQVDDMVEDLRRCALRHPARRAARRPPGARARGAGARRRGARRGRAGARRAGRPVRHRPVARRRAGAPRPAARRARAGTARGRRPRPRSARVLALPAAWRRPATALVGRDDDVAAGRGRARRRRRWSRSSRPAAPARPGWRARSPGARSPRAVRARHRAGRPARAGRGAADGARGDRRLRRDGGTRGPRPSTGACCTPEDRLRLAAQDLDGLVVLDNCEHVLDAAAVRRRRPAGRRVAGRRRAGDEPGTAGPRRRVRAPAADAARRRRARAAGDARPGRPGERRLGPRPRARAVPPPGQPAARARAGGRPAAVDDRRGRARRADRPVRAAGRRPARAARAAREPVGDGRLEPRAARPARPRPVPAARGHPRAVHGRDRRRRRRRPDRARRAPRAGHAGRAVAAHARRAGRRAGALPDARDRPRVRRGPARRRRAPGGRDGRAGALVAGPRPSGWPTGSSAPGRSQSFDRCAAEQETFLAALRWAVEHDDEAGAGRHHRGAVPPVERAGPARRGRSSGRKRVLLGRRPARPAGRRRCSVGAASGRPLPDADRLAATCLFAEVNAGVSASMRLAALAWRALRLVLAERPGEVSAADDGARRRDARARLQRRRRQPGRGGRLIASDDPFLHGLGLFMRAAVQENAGDPMRSSGDAREAYRQFESIGDHWGMGMAAQGVGQWESARGGADAAGVAACAGCATSSWSGRCRTSGASACMLDVQRALDGDGDALRPAPRGDRRRRRSTTWTPRRRCSAWRTSRGGPAARTRRCSTREAASAAGRRRCRSSCRRPDRLPRRRRRRPPARRRHPGRASRPRPMAHAVDLLAAATPEALVDPGHARARRRSRSASPSSRRTAGTTTSPGSLWSLGMRLGANLVMLFQLGIDGPLADRPRRRRRPGAPARACGGTSPRPPRPPGSAS